MRGRPKNPPRSLTEKSISRPLVPAKEPEGPSVAAAYFGCSFSAAELMQ
jgi:hypothetical protein